jgi:serine/threonine protein kinase
VAKVAAEIGTTASQYQLLAKLASGGMAEIFLARGASVVGVERYCVLKRILRERASDAEFVQMFVHEARLVAQLQHPNIASVYDIGMLGDSYFFTMEYVHGETIRSLLRRARELHRPLPLACVLTIIAGAAAGLHHAHERNSSDGRPLGIVHRDVSPSNLMVSYEGNVKVVDFGIAKAENHTVETRSGTVKGKISYLSPEQCRSARVDRRSDVFSLGIVLWEMLTGERLYQRDSEFDTMTAIVHEAARPPSARRSELPSAIDDLVVRMLAKSPEDRFQTAAEVVDAVDAVSMQVGTILSTSAVSRLVRELFGVRAEPWLELGGDGTSPEPSSAESRPIPRDLGAGPSDAADARIVGALDPILSRLVAERCATSTPSNEGMRPQTERVTEVDSPAGLSRLASSTVSHGVASADLDEQTSPPSSTGTRTSVFAPSGGAAQVAPPEHPVAASAAPRASVPLASRITRRLTPVGTIAAALGALAIWLAMRPVQEAPPARETTRVDAALANRTPEISPSEELVPGDARHAVDPAYIAAWPHVIDVAQHTRPPPIAEPRPPAAPPMRPRAAIGAGSARQVPPDAAPTAPVQSAPVAPDTADPSLEVISSRFRNNDYAVIVRICRAAPLNRDIAGFCVMAACQQLDSSQVARWLPFDDPGRRGERAAFCKEHGGVDIKTTLDCDANPLDCR